MILKSYSYLHYKVGHQSEEGCFMRLFVCESLACWSRLDYCLLYLAWMLLYAYFQFKILKSQMMVFYDIASLWINYTLVSSDLDGHLMRLFVFEFVVSFDFVSEFEGFFSSWNEYGQKSRRDMSLLRTPSVGIYVVNFSLQLLDDIFQLFYILV